MSSHLPIDSAAGRCAACACGAPAERPAERPAEMGRRHFVALGAMTLAAAALAACSVGSELTSPGAVSATSLKLSDFPTLATVGGVTTTTISGVPIAIVRTGASTFSAFSRICPHQGSTINVTTSGFVCPNHGATFNTSGQWTGGQRTSNLVSYPVTYDAASATITVGG